MDNTKQIPGGYGDGYGYGEDIDVLGVVKGGDAEAPVVNESLTAEPPTWTANPDPAQNPRAMPAHASIEGVPVWSA